MLIKELLILKEEKLRNSQLEKELGPWTKEFFTQLFQNVYENFGLKKFLRVPTVRVDVAANGSPFVEFKILFKDGAAVFSLETDLKKRKAWVVCEWYDGDFEMEEVFDFSINSAANAIDIKDKNAERLADLFYKQIREELSNNYGKNKK